MPAFGDYYEEEACPAVSHPEAVGGSSGVRWRADLIDWSCARTLATIRRSWGCCGCTGTFTLRSSLGMRSLDGRPVSRYVSALYMNHCQQ